MGARRKVGAREPPALGAARPDSQCDAGAVDRSGRSRFSQTSATECSALLDEADAGEGGADTTLLYPPLMGQLLPHAGEMLCGRGLLFASSNSLLPLSLLSSLHLLLLELGFASSGRMGRPSLDW